MRRLLRIVLASVFALGIGFNLPYIPHDVLQWVGTVPTALASCSSGGHSLFDGYGNSLSGLSTLQVHITGDVPSVCSAYQGNSYWEMVLDNNGINCGNPYAQAGWLIGQG